jgi:hypothetical protein
MRDGPPPRVWTDCPARGPARTALAAAEDRGFPGAPARRHRKHGNRSRSGRHLDAKQVSTRPALRSTPCTRGQAYTVIILLDRLATMDGRAQVPWRTDSATIILVCPSDHDQPAELPGHGARSLRRVGGSRCGPGGINDLALLTSSRARRHSGSGEGTNITSSGRRGPSQVTCQPPDHTQSMSAMVQGVEGTRI